ncbi:MAG TPA: YgjV family protein [Clostridia bacterium]|nr:YgjV family protein [Clostridia bacterium]
MELFSGAQCVGYAAFVLGVAAFVQKNDRRLKGLNAIQGLFYALHFFLLGNLPASSSSFISGCRSFLALKSRSPWLAAFIVAVNVAVGAALASSGLGWLPIIGSSAATYAMFRMQGVPMRLVLLTCTFLWLANNIVSHSIGGTLLESVIAITNISTMIRVLRSQEQRSPVTAEVVPAGD